ncbi:class I SAM-dependent methyltransferase [Paenactinomyces guangxiensis]|uniref:Class I SAM-dependent methyltransferase n=1 Tax=Paenactinomyces guangxiensis TaxID=1490290 RepID=A0A7W1WTR6_9BACL|nr:class I SAM-dependent methyltransferase [Paenactinomyces guangxiensis]MBA4495879.1 class I SAM-dependent methyltransferase [Paenactinomyces guangxiensis]MBH8592984.1 class I SAM-dependent methyltransferase [Paenactinomyces guangxiensis]
MSDHYYSPQPTSQREQRQFQANLLGHSFVFQTDAGVFSKKGVDFGSRLLIETAEIGTGASVLDLGCGYGPIGIALAASYPQAHIVMVDINERAVKLAAENANRNRVADRIELLVSDGFSAIANRQFNQILFNPPIRVGKAIIYRLFAETKQHLKPGGSLWIVIRKQQGAGSARAQLERLYEKVRLVKQKKGYCIIQAVRD